jgi:hypothetical protein
VADLSTFQQFDKICGIEKVIGIVTCVLVTPALIVAKVEEGIKMAKIRDDNAY